MDMYKLKQIPEDFIVREVRKSELSNGRFTYVKIHKKLRNTLDVAKEIAKRLGIKEKQIGFAGSKDKHAITEQLFSIENVNENKINTLDIENVTLEFLGYADKAIFLGDLEGNKFEIVIRNLEEVSLNAVDFVENYFDEQRFSKNNVEIGRSLIKKNFKNACELIDDLKLKQHLEKHGNDYIGAIKKVSPRLLIMYVHAYQSYLWNETLAKYLKQFTHQEVEYSLGNFVFVDEKQDVKVPLIGFDTSFNDSKIEKIVLSLMEKEGITLTDFVIKQIPELSREGELRDAFVDVKDFKLFDVEEDDLNIGKKKVKVVFTLGKGSYATIVVRKLFA